MFVAAIFVEPIASNAIAVSASAVAGNSSDILVAAF
jgi:hypothetical protein